MTQDTPDRYSTEDVNRIIRRALKIKQAETISHSELLETAEELGIDPARIEEAVRMESAAMEKERSRERYRKRLRSRFNAGLYGYITLNVFLFIIDAMTPGGWWFQWPLLGTSMPLLMRFRHAYFPKDEQVDHALQRRVRRKDWASRRKHVRHNHKFHCC